MDDKFPAEEDDSSKATPASSSTKKPSSKPTASKSKAAPKSVKPKSAKPKSPKVPKTKRGAKPSASAGSKPKVRKTQEKKPSKSKTPKGKKKDKTDKTAKQEKEPMPVAADPGDLEMDLEEESEAPPMVDVVTRKRKPAVVAALEAVSLDGSVFETPNKDAKQSKLQPAAATVVSPPAASESQESLWPFDCKTKIEIRSGR